MHMRYAIKRINNFLTFTFFQAMFWINKIHFNDCYFLHNICHIALGKTENPSTAANPSLPKMSLTTILFLADRT